MKSQQGTACNRISLNNQYNVVLLTFVLRNVLSAVVLLLDVFYFYVFDAQYFSPDSTLS